MIEKIAGEVLGGGISNVVDSVGNAINRPAEIRANLETTEIQASAQIAVAQNKVNEIQAVSSDKFTSRMRPTGGYFCMLVIGYAGILQPFITLIAKICHNDIVMPSIDSSLLIICGTVWTGLNGMRSYDKLKGTTSSWINPDN